MITRISHFSIYVKNQNEALRFFTETLDFVIRADVTAGDYRWLTVSPKNQSDVEMVLNELKVGDMLDENAVRALTSLQESGKLSGGVLRTDDIYKFYEDAKAKGVEFVMPPTEQQWGTDAVFKDNSGNWFSISQENSAPGS